MYLTYNMGWLTLPYGLLAYYFLLLYKENIAIYIIIPIQYLYKILFCHLWTICLPFVLVCVLQREVYRQHYVHNKTFLRKKHSEDVVRKYVEVQLLKCIYLSMLCYNVLR